MAKSGLWKWLLGGAAVVGGGYVVASALSARSSAAPQSYAPPPLDLVALRALLEKTFGSDMTGRYVITDGGRGIKIDLSWMNNETEAKRLAVPLWKQLPQFNSISMKWAPDRVIPPAK